MPTKEGQVKHMTQKSVSVLIVDDEDQIRRLLQKIIKKHGYLCHSASDGEDALRVLKKEKVDVVITDVSMPKMDGIQLTKIIREEYDIDVIMITGNIKDLTYGDAIANGASDFFQKPFDIKEISIRLKRVLRERDMRMELNEAFHQLREISEGLVSALSSAVEARDPYTSGHQRRVADLACKIGKMMSLSPDRITCIRMAGMIHDLGKIAIPAEILTKPSRLTDIEFSMLKTHPQVGFDILKGIRFPLPIAEVIYQHHERMDGSGYPLGLSGDAILIEARVIAIADVVEAMSSHRPYRPSLGIEAALDEISKNRGALYDPHAADACIEVAGQSGFEFQA